jgi:hypothetical protein
LPGDRQKLPTRPRRRLVSALLGAVDQHRFCILVEEAGGVRKTLSLHELNATRTCTRARHADDPSLPTFEFAADDLDPAIFSESSIRRYRIFLFCQSQRARF